MMMGAAIIWSRWIEHVHIYVPVAVKLCRWNRMFLGDNIY